MRRGFALGVMAALGSLGNALAFIGFGFIDALPWGWRCLYLVGAVPLLLLAWIRRTLPETRRFEAERESRESERGFRAALQPVRDLVLRYPGRAAALAVTVLPASMIMIAASTFPVKFLQEEHGWTPGMIPVLMVGGGFLVYASMALAGTIADRVGRRRMLAGAWIAPLVVLVFVPETARRELEEIAPEPRSPDEI